MLQVKSCKVKHNFESVVFHHFASVKVTRVQNIIEKIFMLSVLIQASKKVGYVSLYTFRKSLYRQRLGFYLKSLCIAHQPDGFTLSPFADSPDRDSVFT